MSQPPRISVATPAHNAERYLEECVRSVQRQTQADFEHIIVDDASTDGTLALARRLARDEPRIRVESNERNLGIAGTRNRAFALARGEFVAWLDADDIAVPDRLARQLEVMEASPEVGIVGGYLEFFDERGPRSVRRYPVDDAELRRMLFRFMPVAQPAAMVRRSVLERCGPYDLRFPPAEDLDMLFRIAAIARLANVGTS